MPSWFYHLGQLGLVDFMRIMLISDMVISFFVDSNREEATYYITDEWMQ